MIDERGVLKAISWRDCCPWVLLFRTFGLSFHIKLLVLALFGVLLTNAGFLISQSLFLDGTQDATWKKEQVFSITSAADHLNADPKDGTTVVKSTFGFNPIIQVWSRFTQPFRAAFNQGKEMTIGKVAYFVFAALWMTAVWSIFGGAICRIAALDLSCGERLGLKGSLVYAGKNFFSYFTAPLFPFVGIFFVALPVVLLGYIARFDDVGVLVSGIFGFIAVICGLIMAFALVPLFLGWPLMWGTISTESSDSFDAVSRTYAYTTQRPFHYLFYVVVAMLIGAFGLFIASLLASLTNHTMDWAFEWGAGANRAAAINNAITGTEPQSDLMEAATSLMMLWKGLIGQIVDCYAFSFFFVSTAGIYLLLRRDVDQAELDEIALDDKQARFPPPSLKTDEAGLPRAPEEPAPSAAIGESKVEEEKPVDGEGESGDEAKGGE
ncbi:MAG: hypothetical protein COA78_25815 [Blastopirellula sp.]|nr:MAG: hypothetical protein COA78_25815 [Blastopirellula sp.]